MVLVPPRSADHPPSPGAERRALAQAPGFRSPSRSRRARSSIICIRRSARSIAGVDRSASEPTRCPSRHGYEEPALVKEGLAILRSLYRVEAAATERAFTPEQRHALRQEQSRSILAESPPGSIGLDPKIYLRDALLRIGHESDVPKLTPLGWKKHFAEAVMKALRITGPSATNLPVNSQSA